MNALQPFAWAILAIGGLWVCLVVASALLVRRARGRPLFRRSIYPGLPYPTTRQSQAAANIRRAAVAQTLETSGREGAVSEFLELPQLQGSRPGIDGGLLEAVQILSFQRGDPRGDWQTARLRAQLAADEYLLAERVTDALTRLWRARLISNAALPTCVRVEAIDGWFWQRKASWLDFGRMARGGVALARRLSSRWRQAENAPSSERAADETFPWRVVIEVTEPRELAEALSAMQSWFGIGVDFVRPHRGEPHGRCTVGTDGGDGLIGAIITAPQGRKYGITCQHVLSSQCRSIHWPPAGHCLAGNQYTTAYPDAALISLGSPCFAEAMAATRVLRCAQAADVRAARDSESPREKRPHRDRVRAIVQSPYVTEFRMGPTTYHGPHILLTPRFVHWLGVVWPLLRRQFSRPGDSGAGVVDGTSQTWLGIVVGAADELNTQTYIVTGYALMEVFARILGCTPITHLEVLE